MRNDLFAARSHDLGTRGEIRLENGFLGSFLDFRLKGGAKEKKRGYKGGIEVDTPGYCAYHNETPLIPKMAVPEGSADVEHRKREFQSIQDSTEKGP